MRSTPANSDPSMGDRPMCHDLAVISSTLNHYRRLAQSADPQVQIMVIHPDEDGLAAITHRLRALRPVRRLHLLTPGLPGCLCLGQTTLNYANLPGHASDLLHWRSHLSAHSEILIYHPQVAHAEAGKLLIDVLHYLTGAAIAACTRLPHRLGQGGWEFDCSAPTFTPSPILPPTEVAACFANVEPSPRPILIWQYQALLA